MKFKTFFLAFLTILAFNACQQNAKNESKTSATPTAAVTIGGLTWAGDTDPICEMKVDQTVTDTAHYNGKLYGFCSESCKESFKENPAKYVSK